MKAALALLSKEIAPSALAMAPGITGAGAGRPKYGPYLLFRSCLIDKMVVPLKIDVGDADEHKSFDAQDTWEAVSIQQPREELRTTVPEEELESESTSAPTLSSPLYIEERDGPMLVVPLIRICHGRSGDKGDCSNIGIISRHPLFYPFVKKYLTAEKVLSHLSHLISGQVKRYLIPGIHAINFVCTRSLGGGGLESLRMDRQGKCYAQQLLECPVYIPRSLLSLAKM
eukprot:TRINITY_DN8050_c0_g1_i2.p2 TRINITY_DN8050_c0_g1~~TRINITY_DN8050_c0_g1_i2.p2  ORF type:complete len:228 (-),score=51.85 TRINITY_DN8050_c0_g1_i2:187-870(-)